MIFFRAWQRVYSPLRNVPGIHFTLCKLVEGEQNYRDVLFTLLAGGEMAVVVVAQCLITMHLRFCTLSLIGANASPSQLNLAGIDSAPCSPRRPKPTRLQFTHRRVWSSNRCILIGTVASRYMWF